MTLKMKENSGRRKSVGASCFIPSKIKTLAEEDETRNSCNDDGKCLEQCYVHGTLYSHTPCVNNGTKTGCHYALNKNRCAHYKGIN